MFIDENVKSSELVFSYPIMFRFKWPHFIKKKEFIHFPMTQIYSNVRIKNLTLCNPSNSFVLVQVKLADMYTSRQNMVDLFSDFPEIFHQSSNDKLKTALDEFSSLSAEQNDNVSLFSLSIKDWALTHRHTKSRFTLELNNRNNNVALLLEPFQSINLQIRFRPERLGTFQNFLVIRNNLTILDAYLIQGEVGSAKLKINNIPPLKSSVFFNGRQTSSVANGGALELEETLDVKKEEAGGAAVSLLMKMSESDYQILCENHAVNVQSFSFFNLLGNRYVYI